MVPTFNNYCILEFMIRTGNTGNQSQFTEKTKRILYKKERKYWSNFFPETKASWSQKLQFLFTKFDIYGCQKQTGDKKWSLLFPLLL